MAKKKPGRTFDTVATYAEHRECSRQMVYKAIAEGKIPFYDGQIDREEADRLWVENSARGSAAADDAGDPGEHRRPTLNGAQTLLALRRAEKLSIDISREKKEIEEQIKLAAGEQSLVVGEALAAFPARLTPLIAIGVPRAEYLRIQRVIETECRRLAEEIARGPATA